MVCRPSLANRRLQPLSRTPGLVIPERLKVLWPDYRSLESILTMIKQQSFSVQTSGRGTREITDEINVIVAGSSITTGVCHVFVHHTSASLILCENADPVVRQDLETFMSRTVPDGDADFRHTAEGPDDMAAHVRTILTESGLSVPVHNGSCMLGTWQGIYLWEHRQRGHNRRITVTLYGE